MKTVEIKYRHIGINRYKKILVPDCWEDLNVRQFTVCARIYTGDVSEADFVKLYFGLSRVIMRKLSKFELFKLSQLADFALKPEGATNFFYLKKIGRTGFSAPGLMAPGERLTGITLEHFALFDNAFFDYVGNPTKENLIKFVALLYTNPGEVITKIDFEARLRLVGKYAKHSDFYSIFLNYIFIHRWLGKSFPFLFEEKEPDEDDQTNKKRKQIKQPVKPSRPDWPAIIDSFVGDDIINFEKYRQMPAIIALKTINKRIKTLRTNGK